MPAERPRLTAPPRSTPERSPRATAAAARTAASRPGAAAPGSSRSVRPLPAHSPASGRDTLLLASGGPSQESPLRHPYSRTGTHRDALALLRSVTPLRHLAKTRVIGVVRERG